MVGVYLRFASGELGDRLYESLEEEKETIEKEIGMPIEWRDASVSKLCSVSTRRIYGKGGAKNPENREEILEFLCDAINRFVNTFRPRLKRLSES